MDDFWGPTPIFGNTHIGGFYDQVLPLCSSKAGMIFFGIPEHEPISISWLVFVAVAQMVQKNNTLHHQPAKQGKI